MIQNNDSSPYFILTATYDEGDDEVLNPDNEISVGDPITFSNGTTAEFIPTVVPQIKHQSAGNVDVVTDNCGRTRVNKNGNRNWDVVAKSEYGLRTEMRQLMSIYELDKTPYVQTDLYSGPIEIQDITVTQMTSQNVGVLLSKPTQAKSREKEVVVGSNVRIGGQTVRVDENNIDWLQENFTITPSQISMPSTGEHQASGGTGFDESVQERIYQYQVQLKQPDSNSGGIR